MSRAEPYHDSRHSIVLYSAPVDQFNQSMKFKP